MKVHIKFSIANWAKFTKLKETGFYIKSNAFICIHLLIADYIHVLALLGTLSSLIVQAIKQI